MEISTIGNCFVYEVNRLNSTDIYVGKTIHPEKRWTDHQKAALKGSKSLPHFYAAIRLYGVDAFSFTIKCMFLTEDEAFEFEKKLIVEYKTLGLNVYNVSLGGRGGRKFTETQRKSHSEIQKKWSNEPGARLKNSQAQNCEEVSNKKSVKMKEKWLDEKAKNIWLNGLQSEENKIKHSEILSSRWANEKSRQKLLDGMHRPEVVEARKKARKNEGNPNAKLNWELVYEIRKKFDSGMTSQQLWLEYPQISYSTLRRVVTKKTWVENAKS